VYLPNLSTITAHNLAVTTGSEKLFGKMSLVLD